MNERHKKALHLREEGRTYKEIGAELSVSAARARQVVCDAMRAAEFEREIPEWLAGLDAATIRRIKYTGCTRDELVKLIEDRHPSAGISVPVKDSSHLDCIGFGKKTTDKLAAFLGVNEKKRVPIMSSKHALRMLIDAVDAAIQAGDWQVNAESDHMTWIEHARIVIKRGR